MNHITEQMKRNEEEFAKKLDADIIDDGINPVYIAILGNENMYSLPSYLDEVSSFLASAQLALLQAVREEVSEDIEETVTLATSVELGKRVREHINQERARIRNILDEAIAEAEKHI